MGLDESFLDWFKYPEKKDIGTSDDINKSEEDRFTCEDCGTKDYNMYMVNDDIWNEYGNEKLTLCKDCLEKRMGRKLTKKDISQHKNALVNIHNPEMMGIIKEIFDEGEEPKLVQKYNTKETTTYVYSLPSKKSDGSYIIKLTLHKKYTSLDLKNVMELDFVYSKDGSTNMGYTGLNEILYLFTSINKLIDKHKKEFKYLMISSTQDRLSLYKKTISRISYLTLIDTDDRYLLYNNNEYSRWF